jgi:nucleoside-diphosphate-sugar epimerase
VHLSGKTGVIGFGPVRIETGVIVRCFDPIGIIKVRSFLCHGNTQDKSAMKGKPALAINRRTGDHGAMTRTLFCFGYGYTAQALSRRLLPQGWQVFGTTRRPENLDQLGATGATALLWPSGDITTALHTASHLLISASPDAQGDPVLQALGDEITQIAPNLTWAGYLSTTGVYGDTGGDWVSEDTPINPSTQRGQRRKAAEQAWRAIPNLPLHIFRLAGIYGPGRGPFAKLRAGTARRIIKPGQMFSRIHVDDIAQVLAASMDRPNPAAIYNVCDDMPAPPQDVISYAASLLGMPPPPEVPFEQAEMSPMARSFYAESKRIRNDRIKSELGVELLYKDYKSVLTAMLESERADRTV